MPKRNYELRIMNYGVGCYENGKHLQKTMQILTECGGAVAQASVLFFICLLSACDCFYDS